MDKTCPNCLYRGKSKFLVLDDFSIPMGGFFLGLGFMLLSVDEFSSYFTAESTLVLVSIFLVIFTGFLILMNCYNKNKDICSKCGYDHMTEDNTHDADYPNELNTLNPHQKICTNCYHVGKEYRNTYFFILAPILLMIFGVAFLTNLRLSPHPLMDALAGFIWLAFGLYSLKIFLSHPYECPNCKQKRTMIPLDTPKAHALIKELNLTIPEQTLQQSTVPKTSQ